MFSSVGILSGNHFSESDRVTGIRHAYLPFAEQVKREEIYVKN